MGKYSNEQWYIEGVQAYLAKYGEVPPPWIFAPEYHPYSIGWRMGSGESHMMYLDEWMSQQKMSFAEKVNYLHRYPAPPRWYQWLVHFLWDDLPYDMEDQDYLKYFEKLNELGFKLADQFQEDFDREDLD